MMSEEQMILDATITDLQSGPLGNYTRTISKAVFHGGLLCHPLVILLHDLWH